jgi:hypothetical protein
MSYIGALCEFRPTGLDVNRGCTGILPGRAEFVPGRARIQGPQGSGFKESLPVTEWPHRSSSTRLRGPHFPSALRRAFYETATNIRYQIGVVGEPVAQGVQKRQDPLAHRNVRKHTIDEVRRRVRSAVPFHDQGSEFRVNSF